MTNLHIRIFTILVLLLVASPARTQAKRVTVDVLYGPEVGATDVAPDKTWAADGTALLADRRSPQGLVRMDPATGKTAPACDVRKALGALAKAGAKMEGLPWPEGFDRAAKRALYVDGGDVFVLDLGTAEAWRITTTPDVEEKSPRLSPDGTKVAYVVKNDLWVFDIPKASATRLTDTGADAVLNGTLSWVYWEEIFGRQDNGYWWSPDSAAIVYLHTDESNVPLCSFVDFEPATPKVHVQRYPKAGTENPKVTIGCVPVGGTEAPKTAWADLSKKPFEYVCRVTWLPDGKRYAVQTMNRAQNAIDLTFVDRETGAATPILTETDPAWVNINDDLTFLKDGQHFLWVSERTGYQHIYRYKLDGTLVNAVTSGEWAVKDTGAIYWLRQAIKAVDETAGVVYFNSHRKSSIENHVYRAKLDGSEAADPKQITPERGMHYPSFSPDASVFLDEHSNVETPKELILRKADGSEVAMVARPFTRPLKTYDVVFPQFFTVPAADGFKMPASILKPKDFDPAKKYPVIIYAYGGPAAPTVLDTWNGGDLFYHQMLLAEGFLVASIDNRSATAISKKTENVMLGQMYGDSELGDLVAAVKWLKEQPWVDPQRVGIWGWSGGGTMTLLGMTRTAEFKAGVAVAAVTKWEYYDTKWAEQSLKKPQDNPKGYEHCDLTRYAKNLHGRLMLVHGTYDDNVHPQHLFHFINELIRAGKHYELQLYPMRQHGLGDLEARKHVFATMVDFWKRSL
jgi:dipeptidyl-peptidase-4